MSLRMYGVTYASLYPTHCSIGFGNVPPSAVAARNKACGKMHLVIAEAIQAKGQETLFMTGIFPSPAETWPAPEGLVFITEEADGEKSLHYNGEGEIGWLTGDVFADGHCSKTGIRGLDRASWALVQVNELGHRLRSIRGVVPFDYPQTAQASEFFAALYAAQVCQQPCTLYGDCLGVVNLYLWTLIHGGNEKKAVLRDYETSTNRRRLQQMG